MRHGKSKAKRLLVAVMLAIVMMTGSTAQGNFADNWVTESSSTQPSYFKGQQRGYFTGGGFSGRWPVSNDHVMTISKPRLKAGCGGIDMFLGGFSFLNVDYLVQKLQRILAAAPAAAFDIALKTLAPQVADTIKSLEAIIDKLNNLQLDDCKAAQTLVSVAASPLSSTSIEGAGAKAMSALADFSNTSGATDLYKTVTNTISGEQKAGGGTSATAKAATQAATQGCPAVLTTIFGGGSVMAVLGDQKGLPADVVESVRGFIGDVYVYGPNEDISTLRAQYIPPCDKNSFQDVVRGTAEIRGAGGTAAVAQCTANTGTNANLVLYVNNRLLTLASRYKNKTAIDDADAKFLASLPLPVWPAMRAAVRSGTEESMAAKLAEIGARGLAYNMMMDLVIRSYQLNQYVDHAMSSKTSADDGASEETCQLSLFEQPKQLLKMLEDNSRAKLNEASQSYHAAASEMNSIESLVASLERFNTLVDKELSARFGHPVRH